MAALRSLLSRASRPLLPPSPVCLPGPLTRGLVALAEMPRATPPPALLLLQARGLKPAIRDPERPKRPTSAWLRFLQHERALSQVKGLALMRSASEKWKAMTAAQKQPWELEYQKARKEYEAEYQRYVSSGKKEAWEKPPGKPKQPLTPYFRFLEKFRAEQKQKQPNAKLTEVSKQASVAWKGMNEAARKPFVDAYAKSKEAYDKELKAYKDSGKEEAWKEKVGLTALEKKRAAAAEKKKALAEKRKKLLAERKAVAERKKKALAVKRKAAAEKKKKAAAERKAAAEKRKKALAAKRKAAAEKRKAAAAEKKKAAEERKKAAAEKRKKAAAERAEKKKALADQKRAAAVKKEAAMKAAAK